MSVESPVRSVHAPVTRGPIMEQGLFTVPVLGNITGWKLVLLQDIVLLGIFGLSALLFPASVINAESKILGFTGWRTGSILTKSDNIVTMLAVLGSFALALCIPLIQAIRTNDVNFAGAVGWFHTVVTVLLLLCVTIGKQNHRNLLLLITQNLVSSVGLIMSIPGKFQVLLGKLHTA